MSIIVKGMEMPIDCKTCPFLDYEDKFCLAHTRQTTDGVNIVDLNCSNIQQGLRHPECPIVYVPEIHGRLIDGDMLLDKLEKESKAAEEHGRDFSFCFMRGNTPCTELWSIMQIVEDYITVNEVLSSVIGSTTPTYRKSEVSRPHGRLIDADVLEESLQRHADLFNGSNVLADKIQRDTFFTAISEIVNAPTVIPADKDGEI